MSFLIQQTLFLSLILSTGANNMIPNNQLDPAANGLQAPLLPNTKTKQRSSDRQLLALVAGLLIHFTTLGFDLFLLQLMGGPFETMVATAVYCCVSSIFASVCVVGTGILLLANNPMADEEEHEDLLTEIEDFLSRDFPIYGSLVVGTTVGWIATELLFIRNMTVAIWLWDLLPVGTLVALYGILHCVLLKNAKRHATLPMVARK